MHWSNFTVTKIWFSLSSHDWYYEGLFITNEWKILWINMRDIGIVEKETRLDTVSKSCAHEPFNALVPTYMLWNPHHILCSQYSYTHANDLIPLSIPTYIYHRPCSGVHIYFELACFQFNLDTNDYWYATNANCSLHQWWCTK